LGVGSVQARFEDPRLLLGDRLRGVYRLLAEEGERLFPHDYFADLYKESARGRPTVPARVVATVMVLQSLEGLSDREACDRLERDLAWQAAAGVDAGCVAFHPTVLVGQRNRLRESERPKRFLEDTKVVARQAGVMGNRVRVLDSTPIFDAVATQDTVTQLRAAIRRLLRTLEGTAAAEQVRGVLVREDDYATPGKPPCDWDDPEAREALIDALVRDALAALAVVDGIELGRAAWEAAELLALVAGQDVEAGEDGVFRIARRVAADRVISTVDPEARHGRKSQNRRFDGYKAHVSCDPDGEFIDDIVITPANTHDADPAVVDGLLADHADADIKPTVMGDSAYASPDTIDRLEHDGFELITKVPAATNGQGLFTKDDFGVDVDRERVVCPAGCIVPIRFSADGSGRAEFGFRCAGCPKREQCTTAVSGRTITVHRREDILQRKKREQARSEWDTAYRGDRPKVERKIAHFVRVMWGGRKARTRGRERVQTDAVTRAAAINLARLATLRIAFTDGRWTTATA